MQGFETPQQRAARQAAEVAKQVAEEFTPHQRQVGDHMSNVGTTERIYGGHTADKPEQLSLVRVQRQRFDAGSMFPRYEEEVGVVHRVHHEDDTLTIQFPSDQHRIRVPSADVQLVQFVDPTYPTVRLRKGQRLPHKEELDRREEANEILRRQLGIPQGHMLPNQQDETLLEGERKDEDGKVVYDAGYWGMPVSTLDALQNRSIPPGQVTGTYSRHFYTSLYNRYRAASIGAEAAEAAALDGLGQAPMMPGAAVPPGIDPNRVVDRVYIPLQGPELRMNMRDGQWEPVR